MSERDAIEGVMRLCAWNTCKKWSMPDSAAYTFINSMVAELVALPTPPAEPEEVGEAMIEAGAEALWDTFRQTDLCTGPTAKATTWHELLVVAITSEAAALQVSAGRMEARASYLAMRAARSAADKKGDA